MMLSIRARERECRPGGTRIKKPIAKTREVLPPILQNTGSGVPDYFALNLRVVLFNCEALDLDFSNQTNDYRDGNLTRIWTNPDNLD